MLSTTKLSSNKLVTTKLPPDKVVNAKLVKDKVVNYNIRDIEDFEILVIVRTRGQDRTVSPIRRGERGLTQCGKSPNLPLPTKIPFVHSGWVSGIWRRTINPYPNLT